MRERRRVAPPQIEQNQCQNATDSDIEALSTLENNQPSRLILKSSSTDAGPGSRNRTLVAHPFAPFSHRIVHIHRRTVTLMLPTLLLLSKARNEIVCSPLPTSASFKEYRS